MTPVGAYCLAFVWLGTRRWVCLEHECWRQFGQHIETGILFLWVDDWEAIFAAALALLAAFTGLRWTTAQERIREARLHSAARAQLSHSLSDISEYLAAVANYLVRVHRLRKGDVIPNTTGLAAPPELQQNALGGLREMIVTTPTRKTKAFSDLLNSLQVLRANLRDLPNKVADPGHIVMTANVEAEMARTVIADASMAGMYHYARGRSELVPSDPGRNAVFNSAAVLGFDDFEFEDLFKLLGSKFPA